MLIYRIFFCGLVIVYGLDVGLLDVNVNMYFIFLDNLLVFMYIFRFISMCWGKINRGKGVKVGCFKNS